MPGGSPCYSPNPNLVIILGGLCKKQKKTSEILGGFFHALKDNFIRVNFFSLRIVEIKQQNMR